MGVDRLPASFSRLGPLLRGAAAEQLRAFRSAKRGRVARTVPNGLLQQRRRRVEQLLRGERSTEGKKEGQTKKEDKDRVREINTESVLLNKGHHTR